MCPPGVKRVAQALEEALIVLTVARLLSPEATYMPLEEAVISGEPKAPGLVEERIVPVRTKLQLQAVK